MDIDGIQCQFLQHESRDDTYYIVNRQAALHLSQILSESLLFNETIEKYGHQMVLSAERKKMLNRMKEMRDEYANQRGNIQIQDDSHINFIIKKFASDKNGLELMANEVHNEVQAICQRKMDMAKIIGVELEKNVDLLCKLGNEIVVRAWAIIEETKQLNEWTEKFIEKHFRKKAKINCFNWIFCGGKPSPANKDEGQKMREDIKRVVHFIWRYALSFVLIYRGDTPIESSGRNQGNWPHNKYGGIDVTWDAKYLTYWPIKMLMQIGLYSTKEFQGKNISDLMKGRRYVRVYLDKQAFQHGQIHPHSLAAGTSSAADDGRHSGIATTHSFGSSAYYEGATLFKFSDLAEMEADSCDGLIPDKDTHHRQQQQEVDDANATGK